MNVNIIQTSKFLASILRFLSPRVVIIAAHVHRHILNLCSRETIQFTSHELQLPKTILILHNAKSLSITILLFASLLVIAMVSLLLFRAQLLTCYSFFFLFHPWKFRAYLFCESMKAISEFQQQNLFHIFCFKLSLTGFEYLFGYCKCGFQSQTTLHCLICSSKSRTGLISLVQHWIILCKIPGNIRIHWFNHFGYRLIYILWESSIYCKNTKML